MAYVRQQYMLDTNIATYLATGRFQSVQVRYQKLQRSGHFAISAVTEGELQYGLARRPEAFQLRRNVQKLLTEITILPWASDIASGYGELRARLEANGRVLSPLDMMIAGHAYAMGATLVTHDAALKRLADVLSIEDWVESKDETEQ